MPQTFQGVIHRWDGSYVITRNGMPYHVPNQGEWADGTAPVQWVDVDAFAKANPGEVTEEAAPLPPTQEELYLAERAAVEAKYTAPWDGTTGGILPCTQTLMVSAMCKTPQDADEIAAIAAQYQQEQANMKAEFDAIDQKYGVA